MRKLTIAVLIMMVIPLPAYALNNVFPEDGGIDGEHIEPASVTADTMVHQYEKYLKANE